MSDPRAVYVYTHPTTGQRTLCASEFTARTEQIRNGGGWYAAVPARPTLRVIQGGKS